MNLQDNLFTEDVEEQLRHFLKSEKRKRVLVFPPVNSYRRFLIHQLVQDHFGDLLQTFSIGQGIARRTVICFKSDFIKLPQINGHFSQASVNFNENSTYMMGIERQCTPTASPEHNVHKIRNVKSVPTVEIYRPPAARRARLETSPAGPLSIEQTISDVSTKANRRKRPDRAVYVPRHRRSIPEIESVNVTVQEDQFKHPTESLSVNLNSSIEKDANHQLSSKESKEISTIMIDQTLEKVSDEEFDKQSFATAHPAISKMKEMTSEVAVESELSVMKELQENEETEKKAEQQSFSCQRDQSISNEFVNDDDTDSASKNRIDSWNNDTLCKLKISCDNESMTSEVNETPSPWSVKKPCSDDKVAKQTLISEVLIISSCTDEAEMESAKSFVPVSPVTSLEKKVKKVERPKSKPAPPPLPPSKINRDECDWDSLFDDNGDCLDPTLIEELTSSVGEVVIEKPKCNYKTSARSAEILSDEFAHVLEIYNFPSEFKSSDLAAVFSSFKNGGFELKWVDDTHCLGVFSSPLVAAEVLASDHPFVKTRPLSEATALSKTKARRSSEFLQPYRSRPETCAALARRLVTKSLGVKLATARQEREQEKIVLREAKEKRRLANKQREDVWEGIITEKTTS